MSSVGLGLALGLAGGWASPAGAGETQMVVIADLAYGVRELKVEVGEAVIWSNADEARHSVTSVSGSELASGLFGQGESFSHTFATPGAYAYFCELHPDMKATVIVAAAAAPLPVLVTPAPFVPPPASGELAATPAPVATVAAATVTDTTLDPLLLVFALACAASVAALLGLVSGARRRPPPSGRPPP